MLRSDLDPAPALTSARGTGVGFAVAMQPVAAHTITHRHGRPRRRRGDDRGRRLRACPPTARGPRATARSRSSLVVSEIFGVHEHIADVARRFAKLGYLAVAPELFVRQGDAKATTRHRHAVRDHHLEGARRAGHGRPRRLPSPGRKANGGDAARLGITGFCWGGRITWLYAAHNPALKAGVAWYGRLVGATYAAAAASIPIDVVARLKAPVLGLYGGADTGIPLDSVERMKAALAQGSDAARRSQFVVYPDTRSTPSTPTTGPNYDEAAARDGWQRCLDWLRANGVA